jgi:molecular chaperone DnaK (HSP70)
MPDGTQGSGRVFGIDLGTTYSAIAFLDETGRPTVCRNRANNAETTPSVVYFESPTNVVVGETAKQSAVLDPGNVVSLIKRSMGSDETLEFHGEVYTPEKISALILRQLAADAAAYTDGPVEKVVISVPAYFGGRERKATENAGRIAGLDVVGILPEPVAAAIHYDLTGEGAEKTVLVYDLGGGTFDTTVIRVGAGQVTVLCTDGDTNLGGADWDKRLAAHLLSRFTRLAKPAESPDDDLEFQQEVATKAEELKKQLGQQESRPLPLRFAGASARIEVTREEFEAMTADLLDRTIKIVQRTLDTLEERSPGATIDEVLLVGGATRMPAVAARLSGKFGWTPKLHDPDLAVAKGAAIFALSRVAHRRQQEVREAAGVGAAGEAAAAEVVQEVARRYGLPATTVAELVDRRSVGVLPKAFGVRIVDKDDPTQQRQIVHHLAFANDPLPVVDRRFAARTVRHDQRSVEVALYEQAGTVVSRELSANTPLTDGSGVIDGIPPQPPGQHAQIDIVMSIDEDGLLVLHATETGTRKSLEIRVRVGMSDQELDDAVTAVSQIAVSG